MTRARIIITAYKSDEHLSACLNALAVQTRSDFEVVIVNNDPTDKKLNNYSLPDNRFRILNAHSNYGFSGGSNLGAQGATTDWIITVNPDATPELKWFETLMAAADANQHYDMLSSTLLNARYPTIIDGMSDMYSIFGISWRGLQGTKLSAAPIKNYKSLAPCGAVAAYRRIVFEKNGGFDPSYFCYLEDIDLALRLQLQGHKCLHVIDARATHVGGASTGEGSAFQYFYTYRNQVRLMVKNMPVGLLALMVPAYSTYLLWILLRTIRQPNWNARIKGIATGWLQLRSHTKARKPIQKSRNITILQLAELLSWSPLSVRHKKLKSKL